MMNRKEIKISIPPGTVESRCRACRRAIYWVQTAAGKMMPVDPDGTSHFATCESADRFRRKKSQRPLRQEDLFEGGQG